MSRYCYDAPVEFKLKEKVLSLSGDSFKIVRVDTGEEVFSVAGSALSLRDSKKLCDSNGNAIYKMTESLVSLRGRMQIQDCATGETVFTLRKKGVIPIIGTNTIRVWRGDDDDGEPALEVDGSLLQRNFKIKDRQTGQVLCNVHKKSLNLRNMLFEQNTYMVTVTAGVNAALMVFLVIAIDEQYHEE